MTVRVRLFADIREKAGKQEIETEGGTVGEVLKSLTEKHPELEERIFEDGEVRPHLNLMTDGEPADTGTTTDGVEEVAVYPPVSGGNCVNRN